ncbi:cobalamin biosynthesis protein [Pseudomonas fluorescens]|uniref:Cobalamin biosynthesis protein n=1 Tax=Pseudomonas fluorescens TaxID=294 RepID=A0A944HHD4_PSEFL|nr:cobalamin biosynthesis protein [Pseudomonas fluorescens]MBT2298274.1 cobalamin biosynthesis protein [Pseudomonas fluorescens]MBT2309603.1 cobalamin biosynthesis protein [Pseudomonas fluorescens]MBT2314767.1 cobalamin biosynthesis protein [Pseudomonas fluorescens]MBT2330684.1 cobalamin biosynthesis protein [Pseudomonas fluorescens]MBT2345420.1 cobalamin biosynthesis protein [Pseudomonas fluorescens]
MSAGPILVVGLGCQRGCPASTLRALLDQTLLAHGIELSRVRALASIDLKRDEPGLLELAEQLKLPLTCFNAGQLSSYQQRLSHRSEIAFEHTGCYGVAESAALALADRLGATPATLLIPRQKIPNATLALAVTS